MPSHVTYAYIRQNPDIREYIRRADMSLAAIGYTEHSFAHVEKAAHNAAMILETLQYPARQVELAKIAGFLHDIGNVINRNDHASWTVWKCRWMRSVPSFPPSATTMRERHSRWMPFRQR